MIKQIDAVQANISSYTKEKGEDSILKVALVTHIPFARIYHPIPPSYEEARKWNIYSGQPKALQNNQEFYLSRWKEKDIQG